MNANKETLLSVGDTQVLYHCTPTSNVESILHEGLIPRVGERSEQLGEVEGIFLFTSYLNCEEALLNWFGDEFDDDVELTTLKVTLPSDFQLETTTADYEKVARQPILPKYISFYKNEG